MLASSSYYVESILAMSLAIVLMASIVSIQVDSIVKFCQKKEG